MTPIIKTFLYESVETKNSSKGKPRYCQTCKGHKVFIIFSPIDVTTVQNATSAFLKWIIT